MILLRIDAMTTDFNPKSTPQCYRLVQWLLISSNSTLSARHSATGWHNEHWFPHICSLVCNDFVRFSFFTLMADATVCLSQQLLKKIVHATYTSLSTTGTSQAGDLKKKMLNMKTVKHSNQGNHTMKLKARPDRTIHMSALFISVVGPRLLRSGHLAQQYRGEERRGQEEPERSREWKQKWQVRCSYCRKLVFLPVHSTSSCLFVKYKVKLCRYLTESLSAPHSAMGWRNDHWFPH